MIRHCVFINFKDNVSQAAKTQLFANIDALKHHLSGIIAIHIAENSSPEIGMDKGFSEGFMIDFEDASSRDAYLDDEQHKQAGAQLVAHAKDGATGIFVYDMTI